MNPKLRGRIILVGLVVMFALPAIIAKTFLSQNWYQSGVTNKGTLIEPAVSFSGLGIVNPFQQSQWQLGYVIPKQCDDFCQRQLFLLGQSHIALGKYQGRVAPVVFTTPDSDRSQLVEGWNVVEVNDQFIQVAQEFDYIIVDPIGQLVMRYPKVLSQDELVSQSKDVLADLRKLLKLSRVG